ncbi:SDR family oxidoreductase [candidate division KSB3 bacterium]|uniref:SDR family oxidoreductase n=1 Tax=candidate division KSB3 bacterium TaxID=2044937 RepID=A0A9D5JWH3_9BACT|nr:SDR family oxidoreductase [candidate division KSB3 bacterium]MBD3325400.1 SDR family oxidoreductase [candidate division KSB3 bacterium]
MMFRLEGRTALVTGAATGIGQAIAVALVQAGADVAISDKPEVSLAETEALCQPSGQKLFTLAMDVRDLAQIQDGVATVEAAFDRIDILVNNAGINRPTPGVEVDQENWEDHFQTNVRGGFFCAQAVVKGMIARQFGRIIFISSQSGLIGIPGQIVYCATKGAIVNMVRTMGVEWAKYGITVNSVAPTFIETNLTRERLQNPEFLNFVLSKIPKGELATSEDVAHAVVYLASDEAGMTNCVNLPVDGGWTAW